MPNYTDDEEEADSIPMKRLILKRLSTVNMHKTMVWICMSTYSIWWHVLHHYSS